VQAWDRFAYTNNNPVRYTDPSGHCIDDDPANCWGGSPAKPPAQSPQTGEESLVNPDHCKKFGECEIISFDIGDIPGTADFYSNLGKTINILVLATDINLEVLAILAVFIGYISGAAWTGGTPITGVPGSIIGWSTVQMTVQPILKVGNYTGLLATMAGTIADDKAGSSNVGLTIIRSSSGVRLDVDMQLSPSVQTSWGLTYLSFQGQAQLTETSLLLQIATVANDYGTFPSLPWGTLNFSSP
jgi:hypothetical protein